MTKIHALHHQTGELLGTLDNLGDRIYWGDNYIRDLNGEHSFEFQMPSTIKESAFFYGRSRFLIERDLGDYEEFLVYLSDTNGQVKYIRAVASYSDMDRDFLIGPGKYSGTMKELSALVLYPNGSYRQRILEYGNIRTIILEKPIGAYEFLCRLMNLFDMEMDFFVKVTGNSIEGRYVDILKRLGEDRGKLVEIGRDLISLSVKENSENIFTALMCIGPEREDGTFLQKTIFDGDAFQRWNFEGKHRFGVYVPQSDDSEMTLEELESYGRTELNKRIASVYEYDIEVASIGSPMYFGDRQRIKDPTFNPPFYASSRVIRIEKSISSNDLREIKLGEVATFTEDEVMAAFRSLQMLYGTRVIKAPIPPVGNPKVIWIKTEEGSDFEVAHTWNGSEWIPITPTRAEQIGAETPEGAKEKAELEKLQGQGTQLSKEQLVNEGIYTKLLNSNAIRTVEVREELEAAYLNYFERYEILYLLIQTALVDAVLTGVERTAIATATEHYQMAAMRYEEAITDAFEDISLNKAKDAELASKDFTRIFSQKKVTQDDAPPPNPTVGDLWLDTSKTPNVWKRWDGGFWRKASNTTFEEMDGQVTRDKIAPNAVGTTQIDAGAITEQKMKWSTHLIF